MHPGARGNEGLVPTGAPKQPGMVPPALAVGHLRIMLCFLLFNVEFRIWCWQQSLTQLSYLSRLRDSSAPPGTPGGKTPAAE